MTGLSLIFLRNWADESPSMKPRKPDLSHDPAIPAFDQQDEQFPFPYPDLSTLINYGEINNYLNVGDADEIARLATNLVSIRTRFDASDLVDKAIAIREKVEENLKIKRYRILALMIPQTLDALGDMLEISTTSLKSDPMLFFDPVKGPVAYQLYSAGKLGTEVPLPRQTNANSLWDGVSLIADSLLDGFDERTALKRPHFPCELEELLRYVSNDPDTPWDSLHAAFQGFLRIATPYEQDEEISEILRLESGKRDDLMADLGMYSKSNPAPDYLSAMIGTSEILIAEFQEILDYRNSFTPFKKCPERIELEASKDYEELMNQPAQIAQTLLVQLKRFDFPSFWRKHRATYMQIETAKKIAKGKISSKNSTAGKKGSNVAGSSIWKKRDQKLSDYCKSREIPMQGDDLSDFYQNFAASCSSNPKTQAKIESYYGTLRNYIHKLPTPTILRDIAELLARDNIKNASSSTIEKSLTTLREIKAPCENKDPVAKALKRAPGRAKRDRG